MIDALPWWDLAGTVTRGLSYLAIVSVPGMALVFALLWRPWSDDAVGSVAKAGPEPGPEQGPETIQGQRHLLMVQLVLIVLGWLTISLHFLIQIGDINQQGLSGMLDYQMGAILAESALGDGTRLRLGALALAAAPGVLLLPFITLSRRLQQLCLALWLLASVVLAWSFAVFGHVVNLPLTGQLLIVVHLLCIAMWVGSLYGLLHLCRHLDTATLMVFMRAYGNVGWFMIGGLLVSGLVLAWQLVGSLAALTGSGYGRLLLLKLGLVSLMMGLGAMNRFRLVPGLGKSDGVARLQRSIRAECVLAVLVLAVTAVLTTVTGPP